MEGRDIGVELVAHDVLPPGLRLDYDPDSETRGVDDIAPVLTLLTIQPGGQHSWTQEARSTHTAHPI